MPDLPSDIPSDPDTAPAGFGIPTHDAEAAADAPDLLIQQYKQPKLEAFVQALCAPMQDLEDAVFQVYSLRWISTASGVQLDNLGKIVGQPREGFDDNTYRLLLQARVLVNRASGGPEEIYKVFANLLPVGGTMALRYFQPAAFTLTFGGAALTAALATVFALLLRDARGAGIGGQGVYSLNAPANTFTLDGTASQALDNGHLAEAFN